MDNIEVEIKLLGVDFPKAKKQIMALGGKQIHAEVFQRTARFDTLNDDLEKQKTFLRVRTGAKSVITLKEKRGEKTSDYKNSLELETEVGDASIVEEILRHLGYNKEIIMEKYREDYELKGAIVSFDRLPFGNFVEVEGSPDQIEEVIKLLELEKAERSTSTYWHLHEGFNQKNNSTTP